MKQAFRREAATRSLRRRRRRPPRERALVSRMWSHTALAQRIVFGPDVVDRVADVVKEVGGRRALLVTTSGRLASEAGEQLIKRLGRALASTYDGVRSHVPTSTVEAAVRQAGDDNVDCVVSFGG